MFNPIDIINIIIQITEEEELLNQSQAPGPTILNSEIYDNPIQSNEQQK